MKIYKEHLKGNWKQDYNFSIETEDVLKLFFKWAQLKNNERLVVEDFGKGKAFELILDNKNINICISLYQDEKTKYNVLIKDIKEGLYNFLTRLYSYDFVASY